MDVKKILGLLVIVFVLFWVISQPTGAASSVNNLMSNLRSAGTSMTTFMQNTL